MVGMILGIVALHDSEQEAPITMMATAQGFPLDKLYCNQVLLDNHH
jgi:hypothetical protein